MSKCRDDSDELKGEKSAEFGCVVCRATQRAAPGRPSSRPYVASASSPYLLLLPACAIPTDIFLVTGAATLHLS